MVRGGAVALGVLSVLGLSVQRSTVEVLRSVGGLPAHVAGRFEEIGACERAASGDFLVFDRRAHMVYAVPADDGPPREVVGVGVEPGRLLRANAFDLAPDRTFVVADAPYGQPRVQFFFETGARLGGFNLPRGRVPQVTLDGVVVSGVASVEYTGAALYVSQPETGALISEYAVDGRAVRAFGDLRATGHEADRDLHLALNTGRIVVNPKGGFYFVFLGGAPIFRKYDAGGVLLFERYIQGPELDDYSRGRPTAWPKRRGADEFPLVAPAVRTAEADADGSLWISLAVPYTYVYDADGERRRTVQFRAAGLLSPNAMAFGAGGRLFVTPGCYAFDTKGDAPVRKRAARGRTP